MLTKCINAETLTPEDVHYWVNDQSLCTTLEHVALPGALYDLVQEFLIMSCTFFSEGWGVRAFVEYDRR